MALYTQRGEATAGSSNAGVFVNPRQVDLRVWGVLLLLLLSATSLALAPLALPSTYSWIAQGTSESAAQGVENAWIARLGFLLFGFAVILLNPLARKRWGPWGSVLLGIFGVLMVSAAAFSNRPWLPGVTGDDFEDLLHSIAASGMGIAFAGGVVAVGIKRVAPSPLIRAFDLVALAASVVLPMGMSLGTEYTGLLQRLMFSIAMVWFGLEALRSRKHHVRK